MKTETCNRCGGSGRVRIGYIKVSCSVCGGSGKMNLGVREPDPQEKEPPKSGRWPYLS